MQVERTMQPRGAAAALLLGLALALGAGAASADGPRTDAPWQVAQADPMAEGEIGIQSEPGREGVDADVRFEFGEKEQAQTPPVSAANDGGDVDAMWIALGFGVLAIVLLIAILARSGGGTTAAR